MAHVIRSPASVDDIYDIAAYIARDNLDAALRLTRTFDRIFHQLAEFPGLGPLRPELGVNLRSFPEGAYLIIYRPISDGIEVVRVIHGARNLPGAMNRR